MSFFSDKPFSPISVVIVFIACVAIVVVFAGGVAIQFLHNRYADRNEQPSTKRVVLQRPRDLCAELSHLQGRTDSSVEPLTGCQ
jgi:signal transduction histidine kinase